MIIIYHLHMPFLLLGHLLKCLFIVNFHLQYKKKIEINSFVSYNIIFIRSLISILDKRIPICLPINPVSSAVCVLMTVETPIRGS